MSETTKSYLRSAAVGASVGAGSSSANRFGCQASDARFQQTAESPFTSSFTSATSSSSSSSCGRRGRRWRRKGSDGQHEDETTDTQLGRNSNSSSSSSRSRGRLQRHQQQQQHMDKKDGQLGGRNRRGPRTMLLCRRAFVLKASLLALAVAISLHLPAGCLCESTSASASTSSSSSSSSSSSLTEQPPANATAARQQPLGELVAIGGISLLEQPAARGRLVDRIASRQPLASALDDEDSGGGGDVHDNQGGRRQQEARNNNNNNKLDYIVEFMRANKLTKFCDLLTSPEPEIRRLNRRLNALSQFTLFVPTNEALLLMPSGQLELIRERPEEASQFLMAHATSELVVPKLSSPHQLARANSPANGDQHQPSSSSSSSTSGAATSTSLVFSLVGSPLRVVTTTGAVNQTNNTGTTTPTKLELIVNGANIISGHSYALQEPNNSSATYAIVHLVDRALYPVPKVGLAEKVRQLAPRMASYIELARDPQLEAALESVGGRLSTLFVPNDDAFRATPAKLIDQLETNRTFLVRFLRAHLVDGLFYSGQLSSAAGKLSSFAGTELEFEPKTLQSRTLVLVNSIPVIEPDIMALNGVAHLISRPIFERHLLDACHCGYSNQTHSSSNRSPPAASSSNLTEAAIYERLWPNANGSRANVPTVAYELDLQSSPQNSRIGSGSGSNINWQLHHAGGGGSSSATGVGARGSDEVGPSGNELEREESRADSSRLGPAQTEPASGARSRTQRSGIVARNNRDFYRPSSAPDNLLFIDHNSASGQSQGASVVSAPSVATTRIEGDVVEVAASAAASDSGSRSSLGQQQIFINRNELNQLLAANGSLAAGSATVRQQQAGEPSINVDDTASTRQRIAENNWRRTGGGSGSSNSGAEIFDVDNYKVVLNATSRQRMREQLRDSSGAPISTSGQPQFIYDRPLTTTGSVSVQDSATGTGVGLNPTEPSVSLFIGPSSMPASRRPYASQQQPSPAHSSGSNSTTTRVGVPTTTQPAAALNGSSQWSAASNADQLALAASRQQRLLKFQPEDARDDQFGSPLPGTRIHPNASGHLPPQRQPAYDIEPAGAPQAKLGRQPSGLGARLTAGSAQSGFSGCAFYDAECKRLVGKLVRLPPIRSGQQLKSPAQLQQQQQHQLLLATASNQTVRVGSPSDRPHLDSTFGETTENPINSNSWQPKQQQQQQQQQQQAAFNRLNSPRLSPLNQPLPPWSEEEHKLGNQPLSPNWRAQDGDISRITTSTEMAAGGAKLAAGAGFGFTHGLSRGGGGGELSKFSHHSVSSPGQHRAPSTQATAVQSSPSPSAQILLLPVKVLQQDHVRVVNLTAPPTATTSQQQQQPQQHQQHFIPQDGAIFLSPVLTRQQFSVAHQKATSTAFDRNNQQYHTPTPYSVSLVTTHMPPMFGGGGSTHHLGRLTNFTAIETLPVDEPLYAGGPASTQPLGSNPFNQPQTATGAVAKSPSRVPYEPSQIPRAPSAHRKQRLQQVQIENNGSFGANFELNPTSGEKQARKIVRLRPAATTTSPIGAPQQDGFQRGDMSITFARLNSAPQAHGGAAKLTAGGAGGLATQASNQALNVSGANFVRSAPLLAAVAAGEDHQPAGPVDFFQNRTIAEIMDDSGLRIDGQQVTFSRLRECLAEAELSHLVSQTGNSLTIFMPTDTAFQRLVQQQAIAHQRGSGGGGSSVAARLTDPSRRHLIPLVARLPSGATGGSSAGGAAASGRLFDLDNAAAATTTSATAANAADRLTLDCASSQVRQILLDHISARLIAPRQLQTDMAISSLSGRQLLLSSVPSKKIVVVDGQPVIAATRAKNGMVYVVNKFLNLTHQVPNVMDLMETQTNLTTFLSYLSFSSLANRLRRETGPLTVLAPTNEAFDQLSSSARQLINSDPAALMDILRGHIVDGAQFGKLISMRNQLKTMNPDQSIEAKVIKPNVYLLDNQMTSMRLVGTTGNGVVNTIDRLIVPAWLKVSMGNNRLAGGTTGSTSSSTAGRTGGSGSTATEGASAPSVFVGEFETPPSITTTRNAPGTRTPTTGTGSSSSLNLPVIGSKPLRFEQPDGRLTAPSGGPNSFFLDNNGVADSLNTGSVNVDNSNNNNNNVFDFNSEPIPGTRSPFLRVATNLTGGGAPDNRLADNNNDVSSATNATKNLLLIEKLANLMQARKFVKYLLRSKVSESLKPDMNYVILVPTDQAIDKLPKQIIDMLERDQERLTDLVNYHVLDTTFEYINTIPDGSTLNTLNEKDILFNWHRNNTVLTASGAVVMGGIQEENIALLVVDRVLYPTPGDILNIISKSPILSNFTALVRNAGLEQQLQLSGPYTLFAPSDFAFNQLDKRDLEFLQRNRETARRFLLRHLSQPAVFTSSIALSNSTSPAAMPPPAANSAAAAAAALLLRQPAPVPTMTISNSLGEDLVLRQRNDYFSVNDVNFSYADVAATNGVVHVIDGLL